MIVKVNSNFRDFQYTDEDPKGAMRLAGSYLDVPEERAMELITARVAERINILTLDNYKKGKAPKSEPAAREADFVVLEDMTVAELLEIAEKVGVEVPAKTKKADLIDLLK